MTSRPAPTSLRRPVRRAVLVTLAALLTLAGAQVGAPAAAADVASDENAMYQLTNQSRAQSGLGALQYDPGASNIARSWAQQLAASGQLSHRGDLVYQITTYVTNEWTRLGENVGYGGEPNVLQDAFMRSTAHRNNILGDYNRVGVGAARDSSGRLWVALNFIKAPSLPVAEALTSGPQWVQGVGGPGAEGRHSRTGLVQRQPNGSVLFKNGTDPSWGGWESLGGSTSADPDITSWGPGRRDVFVLGADGAIWHRPFQGAWGAWRSLGGGLTSAPTAVSTAANRIDVFARARDGALWAISWNGSSWSSWYSMGGRITSDPEAATWGAGRFDVFATGADGAMWHTGRSGSGWIRWNSLGGRFTSAPGAVSWGPNRIDVVGRGGDGSLWATAWNGTGWYGWYPLGGAALGAPDVSSSGANRLEVFVRGTDSYLYRKAYTGSAWTGWGGVG